MPPVAGTLHVLPLQLVRMVIVPPLDGGEAEAVGLGLGLGLGVGLLAVELAA